MSKQEDHRPTSIALREGFTNSIMNIESGLHFTNIKNAQRIIGNKEIFLTPCGASNDLREVAFGHSLIYDILKDVKYQRIRDYISEYINKFGWSFMSLSMSNLNWKNNDEIIPHWAIYGGNGDGCCIEFAIHDLYVALKTQISGLMMLEVKYGEDDFRYWMSQLYDATLLELDSAPQSEHQEILRSVAAMSINLAPSVKHKSFLFEKEIKIIATNLQSKMINYVEMGDHMLPHYRCSISLDFLPTNRSDEIAGLVWDRSTAAKQVQIGPSRKQEVWEQYMRLAFLKSETMGYQNRVFLSEIPYRAK